ncbi:hypothetical protein EV13_0955 [Prochlorococcus sp. MIT 0702]|nr:hypothetical protein EV12_0423 [Prochlorococcus sp. MIT 0701]KGG29737.1 hypothetical protein EV13_0955 [Prochlorococcus sp. MIT 0702]KGG34293.1 hypothetical protein EV14_1387 [Prochlorococcus sp. MIT 0703]
MALWLIILLAAICGFLGMIGYFSASSYWGKEIAVSFSG